MVTQSHTLNEISVNTLLFPANQQSTINKGLEP